MDFNLIKDDNIIEVHNHLKNLICKNDKDESYIDTSDFRLSDYRELNGAFERMGFDENLLIYFEEELIHNKTNISKSEFQVLIDKYFVGIDLEVIISLSFEKRAILKPFLLNVKMKQRTVEGISTSEVERLVAYLNDLIFDTQSSKKNETYSETLNRVTANLELKNCADKYIFTTNEGENIKKTILNYLSEKETDTEIEIEALEFIIKFVSNLKEILKKITVSKEEDTHLELTNVKKIDKFNDNKVNIWGYKFLVPSFIIEEDNELDAEFLGLPVYYSKILNCYLTVNSVNVNWKLWNEYETNCYYSKCIPLPLILSDFYDEIDGQGYIIEPIELDNITEKECEELFLSRIFNLVDDYDSFINSQLSVNQNPFEFITRIETLIRNYHKTDINTLRTKKTILESVNTIKSEIETLSQSLLSDDGSFLQSVFVEETKDNTLTAVQKLLFIRLMQGENLFPKHNTRLSETEKQEFEYLAPLIGSNYQELKSAKSKVEEILSKSLTEGQKVAKINDLNNVKSKFEKIIQIIEQLKLDIEKI